MNKRSIICDSCNKELLEDTKYPHVYSLQLSVIDTKICNGEGGFVYAVHMEPPFIEDKHFCGLKCLADWTVREKTY